MRSVWRLATVNVRIWISSAASLVLAGCMVGPDYVRPTVTTPAVFKEQKGWVRARPNDAIDRGEWWEVFHDPLLSKLEREVDVSNQNLKAYAAAYREAQAAVAAARASLYPTVTGAPSITRAKSSGVTSTTGTLEGTVSWEIDLWGKIRRQIESNAAAAQASAAELASIRLSAQAELATDYFELRYEDSLARLYDQTIIAYKRTLEITRNQYATGTAARSDVVTAETQVQTTQATAIAVKLNRAKYEHAIALLVGSTPADISIPVAPLATRVPGVPVNLPSTLLERRPDIAESERTVQQDSELIGVAVAAYYPTLNLSALAGYSGSPGSAFFNAGNQVWSIAASASETVFDGGARTAAVDEAKATYDQAVANYRETVLAAFQDVEDEIASIHILAQQAKAEDTAVASSRHAVEIAINEYQSGTQNYTTVVTAQTTALTNEQTALSILASRQTSVVSLIRALGGGWSVNHLPTADALRDQPLRL
jgi:NodT family efflux transporter outer membrane factor (OMF) lipoprotein